MPIKRLIAIVLLSTANPSAWAQTSVSSARLTLTALGPVHIGMTTSEVRTAVGSTLIEGNSGVDPDSCVQSYIAVDPGIVFMFEEHQLTRIDLEDAHHATIRGLRIGDTEVRAKQLYAGEYEESRHQYIENGHYLTIRSRDKRSALVIETDSGFVRLLRAGRLPSAEYIEGCN